MFERGNLSQTTKFTDAIHFKNYVRKICVSLEIEKDYFDKYYSKVFLDFFQFENENLEKLNAIGLGRHSHRIALRIRRLADKPAERKYSIHYDFQSEFVDLIEVHKQLKQLCQLPELENVKSDSRKNLFSIFDKETLKPYWAIKRIISEKDKYALVHDKQNGVVSEGFKKFAQSLIGKHGLYFLYDSTKRLAYIGKSINLGDRMIVSMSEKGAMGYVRVGLTKYQALMHVYETFYIIKEKPLLNHQFNDFEVPDSEFTLSPLLDLSEYVPIYE